MGFGLLQGLGTTLLIRRVTETLTVTKDHKVEQERQHIYYDFYLTTAPMFEPLTVLGFQSLVL